MFYYCLPCNGRQDTRKRKFSPCAYYYRIGRAEKELEMKFRGQSPRTFLVYTLTAALLASLGAKILAAPSPQTTASGAKAAPTREVATFAAGCFWSMEAIFKQLKGVDRVEPGYAGGKLAKPSYEQVETGTTGHAEALKITFDPKTISFKDLLEVMLTMRDPTSVNRQGNDEGPQYRSIIFFHNDDQKKSATEMIDKFNKSHVWPNPIVTKVEPLQKFYRAEDYHFDYYRLHPNQGYCRVVIAPEIADFKKRFKAKLKK